MASLRLICALALVGCYDVPQPACGFECGPNSACPDGYHCTNHRCRLDGESAACDPLIDASITETRPPELEAREPAPGETDVELDTVVLVTFDEDVRGVDASTFGVRTDTGFIGGRVSIALPDRQWRFVPDKLEKNKVYEVVLGSAIEDLAGNALAETRWTFATVEDRTPPQILMVNFPTKGASLTDHLIVVFDEPILGVSPQSVHLEQAGTTVPITMMYGVFPDQFLIDHQPFTPQTEYSILMTSAIEDRYGNAIAPTTLSFTTE